jgi:hypothetical protein
MGTQMRTFLIPFASFGLFATAAQAAEEKPAAKAADTSPIVSNLPDDADNYQKVIIQLKDNKISLQMKGEDLCKTMNYGKSVLIQQTIIEDWSDGHKEISRDLDWVICRFKRH